jgi:hypothetical protein
MAKEIRFAVGSREDVRSSVWRLWANKSELYLAARTAAGLAKISFHKSGICRYAIASTVPRAPIRSWRRSKELKPGIVPLFTVVVPAFTMEGRFQDKLPPANKPIVFLPPLPSGTKLQIELLLTKSAFTKDDFRKVPGHDQTTLVGAVRLTHETAWLVAHTKVLTAYEQKWIANLVRTTKLHARASGWEAIQWARIHSFEAGLKCPAIVDIPLGPDNVDIPTKGAQ